MVVDNVHHHITVEATPPLHTNYPTEGRCRFVMVKDRRWEWI